MSIMHYDSYTDARVHFKSCSMPLNGVVSLRYGENGRARRRAASYRLRVVETVPAEAYQRRLPRRSRLILFIFCSIASA
jgi:hypothetical protein